VVRCCPDGSEEIEDMGDEKATYQDDMTADAWPGRRSKSPAHTHTTITNDDTQVSMAAKATWNSWLHIHDETLQVQR